jgi:hypothetical protein
MYSLLDHLQKSLIKSVESIPEHEILNSGSSVLAKGIEQEFSLEVPTLSEGDIYVTDREADVDISRDRRYLLTDWDPKHKKGIELTFHVPFTGDASLFEYQPNAYSSLPPRAEVADNELLFRFQAVDHNGEGEQIRNDFQREFSGVNQYLGWQSSQVGEYNSQLFNRIVEAIEKRKQKLLKDPGLIASIGFPVRKRTDAPKTYAAPVTRRQLPISKPTVSKPYEPELALEEAEYEHILNVISQMVTVMERSPHAFSTMREEDLRQHFLMQLNGQYEGQATGETFNYQGKTDILIRVNNKNVFIAECKFWTGEKGFLETIDQILSYTSWRDTKTAIVIFNRNKDFSKMLEKIVPAAHSHKNFVNQVQYSHASGYRFIFSNPNDIQRQLSLTVLAFDVPNGDGSDQV